MPPRLQAVLEGIYEYGPVVIAVTIHKVLREIARAVGSNVARQHFKASQDEDGDEEMEDDDEEDYGWASDDDFGGPKAGKAASTFRLDRLQQ